MTIAARSGGRRPRRVCQEVGAGGEQGRVHGQGRRARAGVSASTVSRVLGGTYPVAAGTRARVLKAMRELDYVVNAHARALGGSTNKTVAFVVDDVTGPFYAHIARGVEEQASELI
ncbi:LacI family DNA-binding transcriptional regulator [Streptomyces xiangluensis]|uniref:LacI family DNA-binding transcriptional regulator n=1 Tax=Streptomyces xiangluensis TaxID=2665720 RepID=A0ABV8YYJ1_9ACTN